MKFGSFWLISLLRQMAYTTAVLSYGHGIEFVGNLVLFAVVKEFWKSIKNWQRY